MTFFLHTPRSCRARRARRGVLAGLALIPILATPVMAMAATAAGAAGPGSAGGSPAASAASMKGPHLKGHHSPLRGTEWRLVRIGERDLTQEERAGDASLILNPDGQVVGSTGCNRFFGRYAAYGDRLRFQQLGTTKMACRPPLMELEQRVVDALSRSARQRREGSRLILLDSRGRALAAYEALQAPGA